MFNAEIAEYVPGNVSALSARSAFQIVSACSSWDAPVRDRRAEQAEAAGDDVKRRDRRDRRVCSWKCLGALCALGVSDRLCMLLLGRSGTGQARRAGRGRRRRCQTPRSPRSPSMFLEMSRRSLRARRFRSSLHAPPGTLRYGTGAQSRPRPPASMSNAEIAEIAEYVPGNVSALSARSAFQIVSACSSWDAPVRDRRAEPAEAAGVDVKRRDR